MRSRATDLGAIADQVLSVAKKTVPGAEAFVRVTRAHEANVRFARNEMQTNGELDEITVAVHLGLGQRHAYATTNQSDAASAQKLVERVHAMAKLAPEDPESMPLLPPQSYATIAEPFDPALAELPPAARIAIATRAIAEADAHRVTTAGFWQQSHQQVVVRTSTGLAAAAQETVGTYTVTARTPDNTGSGWGGREVARAADLDDASVSRVAVQKALRSASPKPLPAGKYTVILEPVAVAELLQFMTFQMNQRSADEGRSFFTGKTGKQVFGDAITLRSEPSRAFDDEGLALRPQTWIDSGVVKDLAVSRFWAARQGLVPNGQQRSFELAGGTAGSVDELVRGTKRGLLITRFWYVRNLEPQTVTLTGLTRDGVFLVENGVITQSVSNFRFNESPVNMLKNVEALTRHTERVPDLGGTWRVPALRTRDFTMASTSAAV